MIKIIIPGEPRSLQRHRTTMCNGQQRQYDPQSKEKMVTKSLLLVEKQTKNWPEMQGILGYDIKINFFCYRRPSQRNLSEEELIKIQHIQKPDLDNLLKYILDCGNKILWHDDAEIYKIVTEKFWSKTPRTEIIYDV